MFVAKRKQRTSRLVCAAYPSGPLFSPMSTVCAQAPLAPDQWVDARFSYTKADHDDFERNGYTTRTPFLSAEALAYLRYHITHATTIENSLASFLVWAYAGSGLTKSTGSSAETSATSG